MAHIWYVIKLYLRIIFMFKKLILLLFTSLSINLFALDTLSYNKVTEKVFILLPEIKNDSLKDQLNTILTLQDYTLQDSNIHLNFLKFLEQLEQKNYKPYQVEQYYDIIQGYISLLYKDDSTSIKQLVGEWLPQDYTIIKTLIPNAYSNDLLLNIVCEYPKDIIQQYASLLSIGDTNRQEVIYALQLMPSFAKQFLHYNNRVKNVIYTSQEPKLMAIKDIFAKYKFSSNAYAFISLLLNNEYTLDSLHKKVSDNEGILQMLTNKSLNNDLICNNSTKEKFGELSERYVRKIKIQHNKPANLLELEELSTTSNEIKFVFLTKNQSQLDNKELNTYLSWLKINIAGKKLEESILLRCNEKELILLKNRGEQLFLKDSIAQLFDNNVWNNFFTSSSLQSLDLAKLTPSKYTPAISNSVKIKTPKYILKPYQFNLTEQEKEKTKYFNNPLLALEQIGNFAKKPYAKDLLFTIARSYPLELLQKLDTFIYLPFGMELLGFISKSAPLTIKNYVINPFHKINGLLKYFDDTTTNILFDIEKKVGQNSRAYLLLENIRNDKMDIVEADSITKNDALYLPIIIQNLAKPKTLGLYSMQQELSAKALKFVRSFNVSENTDHELDDELYDISAEMLYCYITYGEDEIIYNTFMKMYQQWYQKTKQIGLIPFFEKIGYQNLLPFYRKCAYYGLESNLLSLCDEKSTNTLFANIIKQCNIQNQEQLLELSDIINYTQSDSLIAYLQKDFKKQYEISETNKNDKAVVAYGLLSTMLSKYLDDENWAFYVSKLYNLPDYNSIPSYEIFNSNLVNIQQYYFYNDEDAISSYNNFFKLYQKSNNDWKIEDKGEYIKISSVFGKKIELYANKPTNNEKGIEAINTYFKSANLSPTIVVHRGLSSFTLKTFNRIPSSTRLILDGSCGGFHVQQVALNNAPNAQILCNRNVGTMYINDPIFKQINEELRQGNDIVWQEFWTKMQSKVGSNPYFRDYIPPNKNISAQFLQAYYKILGI